MPLLSTIGAAAAKGFGMLGRVARIDEFFEYVTLLLHGNGTNGAQNNTFLDSSTNNFTITRNGNTTQGAFSPYGDNWGNYFDGSGDYLNLNGGTPLTFGTGDFTIEFWVYIVSSANNPMLLDFRPASTNGLYPVIATTGSTNTIYYFVNSSTAITGDVGQLTNTWIHIALCRSGTSTRLFANGQQLGSTYTDSNNYIVGTNRPVIAAEGRQIGDNPLNGYISNLRMLKGTALYTAAFTPPTAPLTAITNTSLLTCQSNRFIDNSSNNFTITRNGDVSVQRFSPFHPTAPYAAGTIGGSGYFDGSGDELSIASASALQLTNSTAFTLEMWVYFISTAGSPFLFFAYNTSSPFQGYAVRFLSTSGVLEFWDGTAWNSFGAAPIVGAWNHIAVSYEGSGTTRRLYLNGAQVGSAGTVPSSINYTSGTIYVGSAGGSNFLNGYVNGIRLLKGTAQYTGSTYTVPTAPLTAITNTSLLLNFTNGGIIDNAMMNDLETVGNAQISTSVSKFGGGSLAFDGTGDRLVMPPSVNLDLSNGDFTVEVWVYSNTIAAGNASACCRGAAGNITAGSELQWNIFRSGSNLWVRPYQGNTDFGINVGTIASGTWYHVALTRSGNTFRGFLNGVQAGTTQTISGALNNNTVWFGAIVGLITVNSVDEAWNGYIDDLRITRGFARYTANFTPQTSQWQDQ